MTNKPEERNLGGVNGIGPRKVDIQSNDFVVLREKITQIAQNQSRKERLENHVLSVKLQMLAYLDARNPARVIGVGEFLKGLLHRLEIKHRKFASYVNMHPTNFSSLLSGRRKLNGRLAVALGEIFNIDPDIWMKIQTKNELIETLRKRRSDQRKFRLSDLVED